MGRASSGGAGGGAAGRGQRPGIVRVRQRLGPVDVPAGTSSRYAGLSYSLAMRYGFYLPTRGRSAEPDALETLVRRGEALGFHSTVIADHIVFPVSIASKYPYTVSGEFPGGGDTLEQLTLMSFVAAKTERLRLITSVMILPHRNPVLTAKMLATIDVLSRGRVTVGVGVGWLREEFAALGAADFDRRGAVSDEYLKIFKTLWTLNPASFSGEFYRFERLNACRSRCRSPIRRSGSAATAARRYDGRRVTATAGIRSARTRRPCSRRRSSKHYWTSCDA